MSIQSLKEKEDFILAKLKPWVLDKQPKLSVGRKVKRN